MPSIGFTELLLMAVVVIVFVGPEGLPRMMRDLGRLYGKMRRAADELRRAFVLEADRQDAEERFQKLKERREAAREARERALAETGQGAVAQDEVFPEVDADPDREDETPRPESQAGGGGT